MGTGKVLWGLILLVIGVLLLLSNLGVVAFSWNDIVMWWPLLLIYWGIAAFTKSPAARVAGFLVFLLIAAGLIIASVQYGWLEESSNEVVTQDLVESWSSDIKTATFTLQSGAGEFTITNTSDDQLVSADTNTSFGNYTLTTTRSGSLAEVLLTLSEPSDNWWQAAAPRFKHTVVAGLHPDPEWTIVVESGASSIDLDLAKLNVADLTVKSGASSLVAVLGNRADHAKVAVSTGASSVELTIPSTVGSKITAESGLSSREFPGFIQQDDDTYQTADYETAEKTIDIDLAAGVSSLKVTRK